MSTKTPK